VKQAAIIFNTADITNALALGVNFGVDKCNGVVGM
jgi:hypothetical protein